MAFPTMAELIEMVGELSRRIKTANSRIQRLYYENALKDLLQTIETMRDNQNE